MLALAVQLKNQKQASIGNHQIIPTAVSGLV